MTISSTVRIAGPFIGTSTATVFPFAFKVFTATNLQVVRVDTSTGLESPLFLTTDYTVSLNADQDSNPGGSLTLLAVLATGFNMIITSDIANLQPTDLTNQGGFYPEVITDALDRATIQIQQMADELTRSIKIPVTDGLSLDMELPTAAARANSFLAFDATGEPTVVTAGSSGAPTTITRQQFSGTGSQVAYTLASDPGALGNSCEVFVGGIYQQRDTYTIAGTTLTFTAAPVAGTDNIEVVNFLTTAIGTTDSSLVTYVPAGTSATQRTVQAKLRDTVSVKDFGAVGNGVADDTVAINSALASGAKMVHFPSGTYKVLATLNVPVNVSIIGDGSNASIIDGSAATYANLTNGNHINVAAGTWAALPALTTNPVAGASSLVFVSAPSVTQGNIICVYNPTNGSWSGFRTYYRAGEYQRVAVVSGSTITTQGSLYANYVAANVNLYRLTNPSTASISSIRLVGLADVVNAVTGINTTGTVDFVFDNVVVTGCSYACIAINQAWNCTVTSCSCQEDATSSFGGDYGLAISNSTGVHVNGGTYYAARHAITTGGFDGIGNVPNRMVRYSSVLAMTGSTTTIGALDFHGNCEHCVVTGCTIDGGMGVGGDHITIDGNTILGRGNGDVLILGTELKGTNLSITDNLMQSFYIGASGRGAFIDVGSQSSVISANTVNGGTISIGNNTMDWMSSSTAGQSWMRINNSGYTGTDVSVAIEGNAVTAAGLGGLALIECASGVTGRFAEVSCFDNVTKNCGLIRTRHITAASSCAANVIVSGNMVVNATASNASAILVQQVLDSVTIANNVINGCSTYAAASTATTATGTVIISGNTIIDGLNVTTGSSTTNADIIVVGATNVACINNVFGTVDANRSYGMSFDTVTSLLLRDNTAWQSTNTGTYFNAITAYLPESILSGSATYDPSNLLDGAGATTTVTVTGAALGNLVECVSFSLDLQGITVTGYVSAANTVSVRFQNESGGALDLGSGTLLVRVRKA